MIETQCVEMVWDHFASYQCQRKRGHGPGGRYCKQHDPVARKERDEAREKQWEAEYKRRRKLAEQSTQDRIVGARLREQYPAEYARLLKEGQ